MGQGTEEVVCPVIYRNCDINILCFFCHLIPMSYWPQEEMKRAWYILNDCYSRIESFFNLIAQGLKCLHPSKDEYLTLCLLCVCFLTYMCVCEHSRLEEMEWIRERWLRWAAVCLWSEDVVDCLCWVILDLMLICCCVWEAVSWKRQRERWADNPVCLMRLNAGDWLIA